MNETNEIVIHSTKEELRTYAISLAQKIVQKASILPSSLDGTTVECRIDTDVFVSEVEKFARQKEMTLEDVATLTSLTHDEVDKQLRQKAQVIASATSSKYKWVWIGLIILAILLVAIVSY